VVLSVAPSAAPPPRAPTPPAFSAPAPSAPLPPVHALPAPAWPRCPLHGDGPCPPPPPSMEASLAWLSSCPATGQASTSTPKSSPKDKSTYWSQQHQYRILVRSTVYGYIRFYFYSSSLFMMDTVHNHKLRI
jgi:hypothetical protein